MKKIITFMILMMSSLITQASIPDYFIGTLEYQEGQPILRRCATGSYVYFLEDKNNDSQPILDQYEKLGIFPDSDTVYQGTVIATVYEKNERLILVVHDITNVQTGSCHLLSLLGK